MGVGSDGSDGSDGSVVSGGKVEGRDLGFESFGVFFGLQCGDFGVKVVVNCAQSYFFDLNYHRNVRLRCQYLNLCGVYHHFEQFVD
jgi:hypothetical protein